MTREQLFSQYAEQYPASVPEEAAEAELQVLVLQEKQRIQYEMLTGSAVYYDPRKELESKMDALKTEANRRAKETLVLKKIITEQSFTVTPEELETEAAAMAKRQQTTVDTVKRFFGNDLSLLKNDLIQRKAIDWACVQMQDQ